MTRRLALLVLLVGSALALAARPAHAQASLVKAKELYASANYDEALSMLNTLGSSAPSEDGTAAEARSEDAASVAMYRVLCLVAIGRSADVDVAIERLVSLYPLYRPPSDELPPRMRNAVSNTRLKMLPSMVQKRYGESKFAYDRGDFTAAKIGFKWVLSALADPDIAPLAAQSPLADIKTLAAGFVDLSDKALAPPPPPPAAAVVAAPPPALPVAVRDPQRVFTTEDSDVVAPITTRQTMPRFPGLLKEPASGVLEVVIDATGAVESVRVLKSVHPQYDPLIVAAARKWQYQPAQLDGTAVKYSKRIQISLAPGADTAAGRR